MIRYAEEKSPFYDAHQAYCKEIETLAAVKQASCSGFCNSYGYEVRFSFFEQYNSFEFLFIKSQSTQNGVVIPVDALDYQGVECRGMAETGGLDISYGKSAMKRLLCAADLKERIPDAQYLFIKPELSDTSRESIMEAVNILGTDSLRLHKGEFLIKRHLTKETPEKIVADIMRCVQKLEASVGATV